MIIFLLSLIACGEDESDSGSADTGSTAEATEEVAANFYCG